MSDFTESYLNEASDNAMSDIFLKDKNGKTLTGAALQQRLAKLAKESAAKQPLLGVGMPDLERSNYEEKAASQLDWREPEPQSLDLEALTAKVLEVANTQSETLARSKEFDQKIRGLLSKLKESQGQTSERTQIAEYSSETMVPLKDLTELIKGVDDLTNLVVDQDLRINKLEQEINKSKIFGMAAKNLADVILIGTFGGAIIGLCLGILYPSQTKLGATFGFVGSASMALLSKLNPSPNQ